MQTRVTFGFVLLYALASSVNAARIRQRQSSDSLGRVEENSKLADNAIKKGGMASSSVQRSELQTGDQCYANDEGVARKAVEAIKGAKMFVSYCEPCGDKKPGNIVEVDDVQMKSRILGGKNAHMKSVTVNGAEYDLAYIYIPGDDDALWVNVGLLAGCPAHSVTNKIPPPEDDVAWSWRNYVASQEKTYKKPKTLQKKKKKTYKVDTNLRMWQKLKLGGVKVPKFDKWEKQLGGKKDTKLQTWQDLKQGGVKVPDFHKLVKQLNA